ncbi:MAG: hypothetical protein A3J46_05500 [Candidatus Yanofskybacteria bacterium RIFCSPHIGHO2_02_FULL_41_11]|uniref:Gfo/Idh/MocA-like oxidoreductase N-terminal domain-containing protein n=1 Tax=Candidatus Yanofskybacteria bacterium RIFCSPHIGHO2_02_FULL_41_11 TaxID=1802675 RepID=A0A1F8FBR8_9BACT|nr:MAG: hypothetical protein A3J46_05500 [Candidatus Yanofskybacteria bacterium RIFCSPHIGHO2_02_FULL_41_11]
MKHNILWVGFGNFAKKLEPYVRECANAEILYYYPDKNESIRRFGPKACWDIDDALGNPRVTSVFITTPNNRHGEYLKKALAFEKHIFVEKPITATIDETASLLPLMQQGKTVLMVGHNMRRQAAIRKTRKILDSGQIGRIVSVHLNNSKGIAFSMDHTNWRFHEESHREGPLITVGIHLIDAMHYLFGPVDSVSAVIKNISKKTEAPDSGSVLISLRSGATVFLETNYNTPSEDIVSICGTEGSLYMNRGWLYCRQGRDINRVPSNLNLVPLIPVDTLAEEIDEFFRAIEEGSRVETGYQEALNALAVVEACFQSHQNKRWVEIRNITEEYFQNKSA